MRYPDRSAGLSAPERERRQQLRFQAADMFAGKITPPRAACWPSPASPPTSGTRFSQDRQCSWTWPAPRRVSRSPRAAARPLSRPGSWRLYAPAVWPPAPALLRDRGPAASPGCGWSHTDTQVGNSQVTIVGSPVLPYSQLRRLSPPDVSPKPAQKGRCSTRRIRLPRSRAEPSSSLVSSSPRSR